jgi:hypothetical protein
MYLFYKEKTPLKEYNNRQLISKGFLNRMSFRISTRGRSRIKSKCCENIYNDFCIYKIYLNAKLYSELIKLLLPEIIVEYFDLLPIKREMKSSTFT